MVKWLSLFFVVEVSRVRFSVTTKDAYVSSFLPNPHVISHNPGQKRPQKRGKDVGSHAQEASTEGDACGLRGPAASWR